MKGFTLIELMIVVAIIAIIAAIAIPGLLRARISANEGAAIAALRTMSVSQVQFKGQMQIDRDIDGIGEFATIGELASEDNIRGTSVKVSPNYISTAYASNVALAANGNAAQKSGYYFKVYLPGIETEDVVIVTPTDNIINAQEEGYRIYAWPVSKKNSGNRVFVIDQGAESLGCGNLLATPYSGTTSVPAFDAAAPTNSTLFDLPLKKGTGRDGGTWAPTYN